MVAPAGAAPAVAGGEPGPVGGASELRAAARRLLERHWQPAGFTAPHPEVYPWRWLWDSCFHALVWLELGDERALTELAAVFRWQHPSGFVPHIGYHDRPAHRSFWGHPTASTITQPPMYGHVIAAMRRKGLAVPDELAERAAAGIGWLLAHRRRGDGRIVIVHPWESGCDDSPRWDPWCRPAPWSRAGWYRAKGELVRALTLDAAGAALSSPAFEVDSAGFNALVAFNAAELGVDHGIPPAAPEGGPVTADDLLVALAWPDGTLLDLALDDAVFGGPYGPAGVRRDHPAFDGDAYWRGAAWPHLAYLLWLAAGRCGRPDLAGELSRRAVAGALASGWAEHWNPDTGAPGGARPHSWATTVVLTDGGAG